MKKKTVITTEKREVWIIREGISEIEQPIETGRVMDIPAASEDSPPEMNPEGLEGSREP